MVIVEAMALGVAVVSTDCPNGPREILEDSRCGPLVPVEDHDSLAKAIVSTLDDPPDPEVLKSAAMKYTTDKIGREYLRLLLPDAERPAPWQEGSDPLPRV